MGKKIHHHNFYLPRRSHSNVGVGQRRQADSLQGGGTREKIYKGGRFLFGHPRAGGRNQSARPTTLNYELDM